MKLEPITIQVMCEIVEDTVRYLHRLRADAGDMPSVYWDCRYRSADGIKCPIGRMMPEHVLDMLDAYRDPGIMLHDLLYGPWPILEGNLQIREEVRAEGLLHRGIRYAYGEHRSDSSASDLLHSLQSVTEDTYADWRSAEESLLEALQQHPDFREGMYVSPFATTPG